MRSQLERMLSLIYRREKRCMDCLEKIKKGADGKARISPEEAAEEIFKHEALEDRLICFLLLVSFGDKLVLEVIDDLGKRGDGALSVDEGLLVLGEELDELCDYCRAKTIKIIESSRQKNKARVTT